MSSQAPNGSIMNIKAILSSSNIFIPSSFLVTVNNICHQEWATFHYKTDLETTFLFHVHQRRQEKKQARGKYMALAREGPGTSVACAILGIIHKSGLQDRRWSNASLNPTEPTMMYHALSIFN